MSNKKFKIGDLVILSSFGLTVINPNKAKLGIIVTGPADRMYKCLKTQTYIKYATYDVMFGKELLTDIPDDFLQRMETEDHEENPTGLENLPDGD